LRRAAMKIGCNELGFGGIDARERSVEIGLHAFIDEGPQSGRFSAQLGQLELRVLEVGDRVSECLALASIGNSPLDDSLYGTDAADCLNEPLLRKLAHQDAEPCAFLAEPVLEWRLNVREEQLRRILRVQADLLQKSSPFEA